MKLTTDKARWYEDGEGFWLAFRTRDRRAAAELSAEITKPYDVEAKPHRERRSLDANAYFWVLAGKLSAVMQIPPNDVYKQYIPNVGGNYEVIPVREDRIEHWDRIWCSGHVGRCTDDLGPCRNTPGYNYIRSYFSSSDYDTAQMSRLIDLIVQDCKDQGIETLTPAELERMKGEWGRG